MEMLNMAAKNQYSSEQLELAKVQLDKLPDLSKERLTGKEVLEGLKDKIIVLATQKGYTAKDIKSALEACEITVSERSIQDMIKSTVSSKRKAATPRKLKTINNAQSDSVHSGNSAAQN
uniref:mobilization protein MobC n=1 Tax=Serratia proteamaculans TaxID=28151 RepID=UPI001F4C073B|nr:mobilization protein MobC [Serratia proteamaculans]